MRLPALRLDWGFRNHLRDDFHQDKNYLGGRADLGGGRGILAEAVDLAEVVCSPPCPARSQGWSWGGTAWRLEGLAIAVLYAGGHLDSLEEHSGNWQQEAGAASYLGTSEPTPSTPDLWSHNPQYGSGLACSTFACSGCLSDLDVHPSGQPKSQGF